MYLINLHLHYITFTVKITALVIILAQFPGGRNWRLAANAVTASLHLSEKESWRNGSPVDCLPRRVSAREKLRSLVEVKQFACSEVIECLMMLCRDLWAAGRDGPMPCSQTAILLRRVISQLSSIHVRRLQRQREQVFDSGQLPSSVRVRQCQRAGVQRHAAV